MIGTQIGLDRPPSTPLPFSGAIVWASITSRLNCTIDKDPAGVFRVAPIPGAGLTV